ncbi:MAG TPA: hypothetical protein PK156_35470, partial [Polyangium sp.]|nr:hypothetical protein [Polyangium sp.]
MLFTNRITLRDKLFRGVKFVVTSFASRQDELVTTHHAHLIAIPYTSASRLLIEFPTSQSNTGIC